MAEKAFEAWRDTTPSERQLTLLRIADAIEKRAEEIVWAESENTGKPLGLTMEEEIPAAADQIRFFAGAARCLEGKSAGEYPAPSSPSSNSLKKTRRSGGPTG